MLKNGLERGVVKLEAFGMLVSKKLEHKCTVSGPKYVVRKCFKGSKEVVLHGLGVLVSKHAIEA